MLRTIARVTRGRRGSIVAVVALFACQEPAGVTSPDRSAWAARAVHAVAGV